MSSDSCISTTKMFIQKAKQFAQEGMQREREITMLMQNPSELEEIIQFHKIIPLMSITISTFSVNSKTARSEEAAEN